MAPPDQFLAVQKAGKQFPYSNHNPDFFVDLARIPIGAKVNTVVALALLAKSDWFATTPTLGDHS